MRNNGHHIDLNSLNELKGTITGYNRQDKVWFADNKILTAFTDPMFEINASLCDYEAMYLIL